MELEEPAVFSNQEMKVSRVKVSGREPALPVAEGAAEATGVELAATFWTAAEEAAGAAEVAAGAELAGAAAVELSEPEPELAPENRAGPGIW